MSEHPDLADEQAYLDHAYDVSPPCAPAPRRRSRSRTWPPRPSTARSPWHLQHRLRSSTSTCPASASVASTRRTGDTLVRRSPSRRGRARRPGGRRLAGRGVDAVLPGDRRRPVRAAPPPPVRDDRPRASTTSSTRSSTIPTRARGAPRRHPRSAAGRARARAHRRDARHRRHDPGRAGRRHPRAARRVPRRAGRSGHRQDRGRPAPRRVPALRAPAAARRARACSSSGRTRCSCATSRRCCRRSARRRCRQTHGRATASAAGCGPSTTRRGRRAEGRRAHGRRAARGAGRTRSGGPTDDLVVADRAGDRVTLPADDVARAIEEILDARRAVRHAAATRSARSSSASARTAVRPRAAARTRAARRASTRRCAPSADFQAALGAHVADGERPGARAAAAVQSRRARAAPPTASSTPTSSAAASAPGGRRLDDEPWTAADLVLVDEAEALVDGVAAHLRPRRGRRGAGPDGDGAAGAGPPVPEPVDDRARRPRAGDRARRRSRRGTTRSCTSGRRRRCGDRRARARLPGARAGHRLRQPAAARRPPRRAAVPVGARAGTSPDVHHRASPSNSAPRSAGVVADAGRAGGRRSASSRPIRIWPRCARRSTRSDVDVGEGLRAGPGHVVSLLSPAQAKGLEFDAVVVVSPGAFMVDRHDGGAGGRLLYVALTRAVQELTVVAPATNPCRPPSTAQRRCRRLVTSDHAATEPDRPDHRSVPRGSVRPSPDGSPMRAPPWHSSPATGRVGRPG